MNRDSYPSQFVVEQTTIVDEGSAPNKGIIALHALQVLIAIAGCALAVPYFPYITHIRLYYYQYMQFSILNFYCNNYLFGLMISTVVALAIALLTALAFLAVSMMRKGGSKILYIGECAASFVWGIVLFAIGGCMASQLSRFSCLALEMVMNMYGYSADVYGNYLSPSMYGGPSMQFLGMGPSMAGMSVNMGINTPSGILPTAGMPMNAPLTMDAMYTGTSGIAAMGMGGMGGMSSMGGMGSMYSMGYDENEMYYLQYYKTVCYTSWGASIACLVLGGLFLISGAVAVLQSRRPRTKTTA